MLSRTKAIIPPLSHAAHKGQAGRIAVMGGCALYTGAPYYAAMSSLKVGGDISYIWCTQDAAIPIKNYSPELIVVPLLRQTPKEGYTEEQFELNVTEAVEDIKGMFHAIHALVIGPGLGRDPLVRAITIRVIEEARKVQLPLVVDGDGLYFVSLNPESIIGYRNAILTPNVVEFQRIYKAVFDGESPELPHYSEFRDAQKSRDGVVFKAGKYGAIAVESLAKKLGNVTINQKGRFDFISNGRETAICGYSGSTRRCGGQGDVLAGSSGIFSAWSHRVEGKGSSASSAGSADTLAAAFGASLLTRECNAKAFEEHFRSTTTPDMIQKIGSVFHATYETS